jgi:hypothetical protein
MDVLQLIKAELKEQTRHFQNALVSHQAKAAERRSMALVQSFLRLESEYLLPELTAVVPQDPLLSKMYQDLEVLRSHLEAWEGSGERAKIVLLQEHFIQHAQWVEDRILPLIRQKISTAEREELYHVLLDAKQDLEPASDLVLAI